MTLSLQVGEITFASLPIVSEHVAFWTGAKGRADRVEARVRAAEIVAGGSALVNVLASVSVGR